MPDSASSNSDNANSDYPKRVSPILDPEKALVDCDGLSLVNRLNTTSVQVLAFKNQHAAVASALSKAVSVEASITPGICNSDGSTQVVWNGPNQWMVISETDAAEGLLEKIQNAVGDKAGVVDQSHGRVGLRLSGEHARTVVQKNCPLDVHPRSFEPGSCALTTIAHIGALIIQVDDAPTYDLFVNRSFARSFADSVVHGCHEFEVH